MKKTMLTLLVLTLALAVNAQWYANQYGVTNMNELNKEQLQMSLEQATKLKKAGVITTVVSTAFAVIGTAVYGRGLNDITYSTSYADIDNGASKAYSGIGVMTIGYIGMCVGIPLWISGSQRSNIVKIHLAKFDQLGYIPNAPKFGVGLSLAF